MAMRVGSKYQHLASRQPCQCCDRRLHAFNTAANADLSRRGFLSGIAAAAASLGLPTTTTELRAQTATVQGVLFENVRIFDGTDKLSEPSNVLTVGRTIRTISREPVAPPSGMTVRRIAGNGRTLIPGLIDAHVHMMFATVPQVAVLTADIGYVNVAVVKAANDMLLRGFTSVRNVPHRTKKPPRVSSRRLSHVPRQSTRQYIRGRTMAGFSASTG
jgi:hypothetical protein